VPTPDDTAEHVLAVRRDAGAGTVWLISMCAVVCLMAVVAIVAGEVRVLRHRAYQAADQAALAAALSARGGHALPCVAAERLADRNDARLARCVLRGPVSDVSVTVSAPVMVSALLPVPGGRLVVTARARAGPSGWISGTTAVQRLSGRGRWQDGHTLSISAGRGSVTSVVGDRCKRRRERPLCRGECRYVPVAEP
jgi:secretion/DNA translocation related TadE-like protein